MDIVNTGNGSSVVGGCSMSGRAVDGDAGRGLGVPGVCGGVKYGVRNSDWLMGEVADQRAEPGGE